jgi:hypothetical protein
VPNDVVPDGFVTFHKPNSSNLPKKFAYQTFAIECKRDVNCSSLTKTLEKENVRRVVGISYDETNGLRQEVDT